MRRVSCAEAHLLAETHKHTAAGRRRQARDDIGYGGRRRWPPPRGGLHWRGPPKRLRRGDGRCLEKLIRIVKDKTQMSAEIELEHRGDVHNDVLRKMLDAFLQKFLVPTPPGWRPGVGVGEWTTPRRDPGGMIQDGGFLNVMSRWWSCGAHPSPMFTPCGVISIVLI